jgi:hypothetical protein
VEAEAAAKRAAEEAEARRRMEAEAAKKRTAEEADARRKAEADAAARRAAEAARRGGRRRPTPRPSVRPRQPRLGEEG